MKLKLEIGHIEENLHEHAKMSVEHLQGIFDGIKNMSRDELEGKVNMLSTHLFDLIKKRKIDV